MSSRDWLKTIINRKKSKQAKGSSNQQSNGFKSKGQSRKDTNRQSSDALIGNDGDRIITEHVAAIRIQTAYRAFKARKTLRSLKRFQRLKTLTQNNSVQKQASNTSVLVQSWSKIQAKIRARRASMVVEGRRRQKKHDSQLKLEARLHDLELEWNGGTETKEEIIARIQQREEAAVKRERAMAYAFSHQWRVNSGMNQGPFIYELAKGNWEWSWVDKWIAAQPWETRSSPESLTKSASKVGKNANNANLATQRVQSASKPAIADAKGSVKKALKQSDEETESKEANSRVADSVRSISKSSRAKQEQLLHSQGGELVA